MSNPFLPQFPAVPQLMAPQPSVGQQALVPAPQLVPQLNPLLVPQAPPGMVPNGMTVYMPAPMAPYEPQPKKDTKAVLDDIVNAISHLQAAITYETARAFQTFQPNPLHVEAFNLTIAELSLVGDMARKARYPLFHTPTKGGCPEEITLLDWIADQSGILTKNLDRIAHVIEKERELHVESRVSVLKQHLAYLLQQLRAIAETEAAVAAHHRRAAEDDAQTQAINDTVDARTIAMRAKFLGEAEENRAAANRATVKDRTLDLQIEKEKNRLEGEIQAQQEKAAIERRPILSKVKRARQLALQGVMTGLAAVWQLHFQNAKAEGMSRQEADEFATLELNEAEESGTVTAETISLAQAQLDSKVVGPSVIPNVIPMRTGREK